MPCLHKPALVVVVQLLSHVWLCDPMDCSTPGFPVPHCLLEFAQTHLHWVSDAVQPSYPLLPAPFSSCLQSFTASGSFPTSQFESSGQSTGASASALVLSVNIQGWFSLGLNDLIFQSTGLSRVFSSTTVWKHHQSLALSLFLLSSSHILTWLLENP